MLGSLVCAWLLVDADKQTESDGKARAQGTDGKSESLGMEAVWK